MKAKDNFMDFWEAIDAELKKRGVPKAEFSYWSEAHGTYEQDMSVTEAVENILFWRD